LISVWASAPFLHNNSVGTYIKDPSVAGRMTAFEDAMEKLLWPEKRLGAQSIMLTSMKSTISRRDGTALEVPANFPVKLIASTIPTGCSTSDRAATGLCDYSPLFGGKILWTPCCTTTWPRLHRGPRHTFGADLPDADKRDLIEFVKTF